MIFGAELQILPRIEDGLVELAVVGRVGGLPEQRLGDAVGLRIVQAREPAAEENDDGQEAD